MLNLSRACEPVNQRSRSKMRRGVIGAEPRKRRWVRALARCVRWFLDLPFVSVCSWCLPSEIVIYYCYRFVIAFFFSHSAMKMRAFGARRHRPGPPPEIAMVRYARKISVGRRKRSQRSSQVTRRWNLGKKWRSDIISGSVKS